MAESESLEHQHEPLSNRQKKKYVRRKINKLQITNSKETWLPPLDQPAYQLLWHLWHPDFLYEKLWQPSELLYPGQHLFGIPDSVNLQSCYKLIIAATIHRQKDNWTSSNSSLPQWDFCRQSICLRLMSQSCRCKEHPCQPFPQLLSFSW